MSRIKGIIAAFLLTVMSVAAGYATAPEDFQIPVLLANGEVITQPCYMTVDGECVALVDSEETAEKVMSKVKDEYKSEKTIDVRIQEETSTEEMHLENGDEKPEVLTEQEAARQLVESDAVTVETKELVIQGNTEAYKTITNESDEMIRGETRILQQGQDGFVLVTKEVIRENGEITGETVVEERVLTESVPEIILCGTSGLADPLDSLRLTSGFGYRWGRQHEGIDLGMYEGAPIYAARAGTVAYAGCCGSYGNLVRIDHGDGMETYYAHCSRLLVSEGQQVEAGDIIAEVGSTGNSTGPHLHFEVRINGTSQDPLEWLDAEK